MQEPITSTAPVRMIGQCSFLLRGFASAEATSLLTDLKHILSQSPLRHMTTRRGYQMAAQMTNCGRVGWVSDSKGYRYQWEDPLSGQAWPAIPSSFLTLAKKAAEQCDFDNFIPDVCLINCYHPRAGMGLHQDKDEKDFSQPIVSVSLGIPAVFLFGGLRRSDKPDAYLLEHGDVVVWGGDDRLRFHDISPLKLAHHDLTGQCRFNLTFRLAS
jgi:alkylated DNA repair protein (DNA oxidative demethylase)